MLDHELEWLRSNRFFVLGDGNNAILMDELNEFFNLWNKLMVLLADFDHVCSRSHFLVALRKCGFETVGKQDSKAGS